MAGELGALAGGGNALRDVLEQQFARAIAARQHKLAQAKLLEDQRQADMQNAVQQGHLGLGGKRLDLDTQKLGEDTRQFDVSAGQRDRTIALDEQMQPVRIKHIGAQTADLERRPLAEQQEREFISNRDKTQHGYDLTKIGAQGANQMRAIEARQQSGPAMPSAGSTYSAERGSRIADSVDDLVGRVGPFTAGVGSWLNNIPATDARDFAADLDKLKANIAFSELTEMREASKTGGALGQVSNIELGLLQSALGALDQGQSPANMVKNLKSIKEVSQRWQEAKAKHAGSGAPAGAAITDAQEYDYVPGKGLVPRKKQ